MVCMYCCWLNHVLFIVFRIIEQSNMLFWGLEKKKWKKNDNNSQTANKKRREHQTRCISHFVCILLQHHQSAFQLTDLCACACASASATTAHLFSTDLTHLVMCTNSICSEPCTITIIINRLKSFAVAVECSFQFAFVRSFVRLCRRRCNFFFRRLIQLTLE